MTYQETIQKYILPIRLFLILIAVLATVVSVIASKTGENEDNEMLYFAGALIAVFFMLDKKYGKNIDSSKYLYFPLNLFKISILELRFILISNKLILIPLTIFSSFFFRNDLILQEQIYRFLLLFGQGVLFIAFLALAHTVLSRFSYEKHLLAGVYIIAFLPNFSGFSSSVKNIIACIDFSSNYSRLISYFALESFAGIVVVLLTFPLFLSLILYLNTKFMLK